MASVEPHVTQISVSGSTAMPYTCAYRAAIASRNAGTPHVTGYWL